MDSLSDRLKALGFKPASDIKQTPKSVSLTLEESIEGSVVENSAGSFVLKEKMYPINYQHGIVAFRESVLTEKVYKAGRIDTAQPSLGSLLFIDTETSGLSASSSSFAFLVGVGRFTDIGFVLQQFIIRDPGEETAMLLHIANLFTPGSIFVTFNGKSFDIPLLQSRMVVNRLPANFRNFLHLDVLQISRKLWKHQLESCALKDLETAILQLGRTEDDVPGWMIPDIYFDYLRTRDPARISEVIYHNQQDVVSLAALFIHISDLLEADSIDNISTDDLIAASRIYREINASDLAEKTLIACTQRRLSLGQKTRISIMLGEQYKKKSDLESAVSFWEQSAQNGDVNSCIELAMYYEHRCKNYTEALKWAQRGMDFVSNSLELSKRSLKVVHIQKRIERLERKRGKFV